MFWSAPLRSTCLPRFVPASVCPCRLADLLSEVKWVLEDYSDSEAAAQGWVDRR